MNLLAVSAPLDVHSPARTATAPMSGTSEGTQPVDELPRPRDRGSDQPLRWIVVTALLAVLLKLTIAFNTLGTNDVLSFYRFGRSLAENGLEWTYNHHNAFNHPPLVAYYLRFIYELDHLPVFQNNNLSFPFLLRIPGVIADFVVVMLLACLRKPLGLPTWSLIVLALSPVSLMVSGFHGNTDPVMVMFLVLATFMCVRRGPIWCGLFLALSCQIKIIPLLLVPIFACFWFSSRRTLAFVLPFAATLALFCIEPLLTFPMSLIKNVLSYGSFWGCWGITYWLRLTGRPEFSVVSYYDLPAAEAVVMAALKIFIVACVLIIAWRRQQLRDRGLFQSLAIAWIVFFVFSPAVAPQYMVWLMPFVLVLSPSIAAYLIASSSLFLFFFYNTTAKGLPWYLAISTDASNTVTVPWGLWPWIVLIAAMIILWTNAVRRYPQLRLISLQRIGNVRAC